MYAHRISSHVPSVKDIKEGQVYIYHNKSEKTINDWRCDGFNWKNRGSTKHPRSDPVITKEKFQLISTGEKKDFFRYEYRLVSDDDMDCIILMEYKGGLFSLSDYVGKQHGNVKPLSLKRKCRLASSLNSLTSPCKTPKKYFAPDVANISIRGSETRKLFEDDKGKLDSPNIAVTDSAETLCDSRPHIRTKPSVLSDLKEDIRQSGHPTSAYRDHVLKHRNDGPADSPRDKKQSFNCSFSSSEHIPVDDLAQVYSMMLQMPEVIPGYRLSSGLQFTVVHPVMLRHINFLITNSTRNMVLHYDTTFNHGQYFVSFLVIRHSAFIDEPIIPLGMCVHQLKDFKAHKRFFKDMARALPSLRTKEVFIVSDRERAVVNAINAVLPLAKNFYCWNHLIRNIDEWLSKHKDCVGKDYQSNVRTLLHSKSVEELDVKLSEMKKSWEEKFTNYFIKFLYDDIITSFRGNLVIVLLYNPVSGITNNTSESFNAAFRKVVKNKKSNFFSITVRMYFLFCFELVELKRGFNHLGSYRLKAFLIVEALKLPEIPAIDDAVDPVVINALDEGKFPADLNKILYKDRPKPMECRSAEGIGKLLLAKDRISHVPNQKGWLVTGLNGHHHAVSLTTRTCSCMEKKGCSHLSAVLEGAGLPAKTKDKQIAGVGSLYIRSSTKATGRKGAPLRDLVTTSTNVASVDNLKSPIITSSEFPDISHLSPHLKILEIGCATVYASYIFPLKPLLTDVELKMARTYADKSKTRFQPGWITDAIVDAYLSTLTSRSVVSVDSQLVKWLYEGKNSTRILADVLWSQVKIVYFPYCFNENHWIIFAANVDDCQVLMLDPFGPCNISGLVKVVSDFLKSCLPWKQNWKFHNIPKFCQSFNDSRNCGPIILYYAWCIKTGNSLRAPINPDEFRVEIFKTIVGNCNVLELDDRNNCPKCLLSDGSMVQCDHCKQWLHTMCYDLDFTVLKKKRSKFVCPSM